MVERVVEVFRLTLCHRIVELVCLLAAAMLKAALLAVVEAFSALRTWTAFSAFRAWTAFSAFRAWTALALYVSFRFRYEYAV